MAKPIEPVAARKRKVGAGNQRDLCFMEPSLIFNPDFAKPAYCFFHP